MTTKEVQEQIVDNMKRRQMESLETIKKGMYPYG